MAIAPSTIKLYEYQLKKNAHLNFKDPKKLMSILLNTKNMNSDKPISPSYIKTLISAIIWKLKLENKNDPLLDDYRYILSNLRCHAEKEERDHSKVTGKIPKWDDIINIRDEIKHNPNKIKEHLILSLYSYIEPRRITDYLLMKIASTPNKSTCTDDNFYVISEKRFIFNKYKTSKQYKQQVFDVPDVLCDIINDFIDSQNLKDGDLLLGFHSYHQINYVLKKLIGCSIDNLRHSYINKFYEHYIMPSSETIEELAKSMGHSVETNLRYRKFKSNQ